MEKQYKIYNQDCAEALKELDDNSVDSIITDPPYGLGFMGKEWDSLPPSREVFEECFRVLKPGGHLLSFGGTRTYHRMAVAIEDAGFEIRDMIEWVYGSGFPKSLNIGKAVDKLQGNERKSEIVKGKIFTGSNNNIKGESGEYEITKGTSEWEGWGTALKPAHEPICMARKPLAEKTVAENCLKWGTGGINIDGSRVGTEEITTQGGEKFKGEIYNKYNICLESTHNGRFPANLIHDNSEEVRECFPNESERFFKSIIYQAKASKSERNKGCEELEKKAKVFNGQSDKPSDDMKDVEKRFTTQPKANNHPTVKPIALMEYLIKMVTPKGGVVLDPFTGSGTTGVAALQNGYQFIGIEKESDYIPIIEARLKSVNK